MTCSKSGGALCSLSFASCGKCSHGCEVRGERRRRRRRVWEGGGYPNTKGAVCVAMVAMAILRQCWPQVESIACCSRWRKWSCKCILRCTKYFLVMVVVSAAAVVAAAAGAVVHRGG
jgi:hypothetical protein